MEEKNILIKQLEPFDFKNMCILVDRVKDLWTPPDAEEGFKKIYAEAVIRQDMHENDLQFQLTENGLLRSVVCASRKNDENSSKVWWNEVYKNLSAQQQFSFNLSREYISMMDKKTYAFMNGDDVKLDLFISAKKGWGKKLLNLATDYFCRLGFKNLYLWTDCDCNVEWYFSNGYELIDEDVYDIFSSETEKYKTYVFRTKLANDD